MLWKIPLERKSRIKVNYNFLYSSIAISLKELLTSSRIGSPISFDVHTSQGLAHKENYKDSWRSNISESFGVMELVGVHFINLTLSLFGKIDYSRKDFLWKAGCKVGPPDTVFLRLKMYSGLCVNLFHSYAGPFFMRMMLMGTDGYWEYDGSEARLHYPRDTFDNSGRFTTPPLVKQEKLMFPIVWKESLSNSVNAFLDVVRSSGKFDSIDFENALASMGPIFEAKNQYFETN
jgi:predicted dehydrogenase